MKLEADKSVQFISFLGESVRFHSSYGSAQTQKGTDKTHGEILQQRLLDTGSDGMLRHGRWTVCLPPGVCRPRRLL